MGNARARDLRRRQAAALFPDGGGVPRTVIARWLGDLGVASNVLADLATLVRQGRRHHLPGLLRGIRQMTIGSTGEPPLLQFCAGLIDAPLAVYAPATVTKPDHQVGLLAAALDIVSERDRGHGLEMDLDVWLQHEVPWVNGASLPLGWLLKQTEESLAPTRLRQGPPIVNAESIKAAVQPLCTVAGCLCLLAGRTYRAGVTVPDELPTKAAGQ